MRVCLLVLAMLVNLNAGTSDSLAATKPESTVITAEMIRYAGVTRLGDVFLLVPEWTMSSMDGFSWRLSPRGLSPFQIQSWLVFLDGHKVDIQFVDFNHLNLLPVVLEDIESVEIISTPQLVEGEFADGGVIHIHTRKPLDRISVTGLFLLGNETGDPGPYRFTELASVNVDRSAQDGSMSLSWRGKSAYLRGNLLVQHHPFTDVAVLQRNTAMVNDWPGLSRSILPSLTAGFQALGGQHELWTGASGADRYFYYFKPLGREVAVDSRYPFFNLRGNLPLAKRSSVHYRLGASSQTVELNADAQIPHFEWRSHRYHANIEFLRHTRGYQVGGGMAWERRRLSEDMHAGLPPADLYKVYGTIRHGLSGARTQTLSAMAISDGDQAALKGAVSMHWGFRDHGFFRVNLSASQRLFAEGQSYWYWIDKGLTLLDTLGVAHSPLGKGSPGTQITSDLILMIPFSPQLNVQITGYHRKFAGMFLYSQQFALEDEDLTLSAPTNISSASSGQIAGYQVTVRYQALKGWSHSLSMRFEGAISGDEVFRRQWLAIPKYQANYQTVFSPIDGFSIWAQVRISGSTQWPDYAGIDGQVYQTTFREMVAYNSTVPAFTNIDLKVRKALWKRKISATILLRNLLEQEVRYHPFGASFDLSLFVQLGLAI